MPYPRGTFGPYPANGGIMPPTANESYWDGFWTGQHWRWDHQPGGPHFHTDSNIRKDADWLRYCAALRENNGQWLRGWVDGRKLFVAEINSEERPEIFQSPGRVWAEYTQSAMPEGSFA